MCRFGQSSHAPAPPFALALKPLPTCTRRKPIRKSHCCVQVQLPVVPPTVPVNTTRRCCGIQSAACAPLGAGEVIEQSAPSYPSRTCSRNPGHARHCSAVLAGVRRRVVGTVNRASNVVEQSRLTLSRTCSRNPSHTRHCSARRCAPPSCWCRRPCKQTPSSSRRPRTLSRTCPQSPVTPVTVPLFSQVCAVELLAPLAVHSNAVGQLFPLYPTLQDVHVQLPVAPNCSTVDAVEASIASVVCRS